MDDYLFLPFESYNKYVNNLMKEYGGRFYLIDSDFNDYILHFKGLDNRRKCGERLDLVDHDLTNDVCVLFSNIEQKQKNELHIAFGERLIKEHNLISYGNYNPWGFGEYQGLLLIRKRLDVLFSTIGDGDFLCMVLKQQDKLFLGDGRILHPPNDGIRENSKDFRVTELGDQEKGLNIAISLDGLKGNMCMWSINKKWLFSMKKKRVVAAPTPILANYSFKFINVVPNWKNKMGGVVFALDWSPKGMIEGQMEEKGWALILKLEDWTPWTVFEENLICQDVVHIMTSPLLIFFIVTNKLHVGFWKPDIGPIIIMVYDGDPDLMCVSHVPRLANEGRRRHKVMWCINCDQFLNIAATTCVKSCGAVGEDYNLVNGYIEVERDTCYEVGSDFEGRDVIILVAGCKHQIRDFKVAWNLFSTKEMVVASVNMGENSSFVVDDDLAELRTIPFEEGGDDTCTDKVQGWFWLNGSWDVWVVLCWTLLAIIAYTTKDYLNLFNTYHLLQVICKVDKHFMLVYGCMMHDCMVARYMGRFGCKMMWKGYMAIDVPKMITNVTCLDDKAGVG